MNAKYIKLLAVFCFLNLALLLCVSGQNISIRLTVVSGGTVNYNFNSLQKYESGIEYLNWSNLQVFYNDTTDVGTPGTSIGWELRVKAGTIGIMSDGGGNPPLALESIEIEPTITFGGTVTTINLTDSWQTIVEGNGNLSILENILISYRCGTDPDPIYSMLEKPPDYYFVDLEFKVFPRY